MADNTWSSAGSTDGNLAGNWSGAAPQAGDRLIFDATSVVNCIFTASFNCGGINAAAAYTGDIDFATFDCTVDDGADFICDCTGLDLGSGTISVTNGTFDYENVTNVTVGTATVQFTGTCSWVADHRDFGPTTLTIDAGAVVTVSGATGSPGTRGTLNLNGTLNCAAKTFTAGTAPDLKLGAGGKITGTGAFVINGALSGDGLTQFTAGAVIDIATFFWSLGVAGAKIVPCTINSTFIFNHNSGANRFCEFSAGTYAFDSLEFQHSRDGTDFTLNIDGAAAITVGDLTFDINNTGDVVIDQTGTATAWTITGDVIDEVTGAGSLVWTSGTADPEITLSGAADQDIDFAGASVGDVEADKSAGALVLTGDLTCNSFTGTSTGTGDFDPNGKTITTTNDCDWAAAFDFDAAADTMNGCDWVIGGNFTADGQTLNATAGWTLTVTGTAVASNIGAVAYSDASGGIEIDASAGPWTDNGNNDGWNFGAVAIPVIIPYYQHLLAGDRL